MESFVKAGHRCADLHWVMVSRFISLHSSRAFFSHAGSFMSHKGGYFSAGGDCVVAEVRRDLGASQVPGEGFWGIWRARVTSVVWLYFCWGGDEEVELEGGQKGGGQREVVCGCNRRPRGGMLLIHVFHFQPLVPSPWYLFPSCHFSWFQPPAPARLWTLSPPSIQPLSPFTCRLLFCSFLSLHLSYIPMVHLGCGCQLWTHGYYYPGGSFRLQFSMKKIRPTWKNKITYI